jgi:hypothetical protein
VQECREVLEGDRMINLYKLVVVIFSIIGSLLIGYYAIITFNMVGVVLQWIIAVAFIIVFNIGVYYIYKDYKNDISN